MPYFNIMFWRLMAHTTLGLIYVLKMIIIRLIGPRDEKIQNPEEIRSKGLRQR